MKRNLLRKEEDSDPMSVVSNLFDVAMVFAVALWWPWLPVII